MKDAPEIAEIVVTLRDGRWQKFTAEDMQTARDFGMSRVWVLLEFITQLSPPVAAETAERLVHVEASGD